MLLIKDKLNHGNYHRATRNYLPKQVPLELDTVLLHYVSNQLSLPSDLMQSYQLNRRVIQRHQHKIKTYLAVKEYTASNQEELADYLIKQARQTDQITLLVPKVQCFLKEKGILQPALSTLRRLVGKYRDLARREIESNFLNVLKNTVREKLDVLLKVNNRRSILWQLRQTPGVPSVEGILLLIKKLQAITIDLSWLNKNYQQRLARSARYYSVSRVEKLRPGKKYGILVCLCQQLYQDHTDSIIEMLIKLDRALFCL